MKLTILRLLGLGFGGLLLSLIFTPIVRGVNRRLGMVDQPDARRINKIPIPRGGGVAIYLSVVIAYSLFLRLYGGSLMTPDRVSGFLPLVVLGSAIVALGYADDKWSLSPKLKLLGQAVVAFGAWAWAGVGFTHVFPSVPPWLDCVMTMFWFLGAINAFNLIDGVQVERACLSGNGRALEIGNGLCTRQIGLLPRAAGGKRQTEQGCC